MQRKTGARGLRTILENVLLETMYELPSLRNVQKVVVDEAVIQGESKPYVVVRRGGRRAPRGGRRTPSDGQRSLTRADARQCRVKGAARRPSFLRHALRVQSVHPCICRSHVARIRTNARGDLRHLCRWQAPPASGIFESQAQPRESASPPHFANETVEAHA